MPNETDRGITEWPSASQSQWATTTATTATYAGPQHNSPHQTPKSRHGLPIRAALEFCPHRESDDRGQTLRDAVDPTEAPFPHETQ